MVAIDAENAERVLESSLAFFELTGMSADMTLWSARRIADTGENRVERSCLVGELARKIDEWNDNDADGQLSASDSVSRTYSQCRHHSFPLTYSTTSTSIGIDSYDELPIRPGGIATDREFSVAGGFQMESRSGIPTAST